MTVWQTKRDAGENPLFPPEVAVHLVEEACQRPDMAGRSLSQWDCTELACQLVKKEIVDSISPQTVRRILESHQLKPWRSHMWINPGGPRDENFYETVLHIIGLYTRPLGEDEVVLSLDEKTSLQPRPRRHPTKAALPGNSPNFVEHNYTRAGALQLFAAFNTRTGHVYGACYDRKRQVEFIAFLEKLDNEVGADIRKIHVVCDNLKVHSGKMVQSWLKAHPRFKFHFTPVHCSWMNQVEQWFSILARKRFRIVDFASKADLRAKIEQFIEEWNQHAHPFNWSTKSVAKVMSSPLPPFTSLAQEIAA